MSHAAPTLYLPTLDLKDPEWPQHYRNPLGQRCLPCTRLPYTRSRLYRTAYPVPVPTPELDLSCLPCTLSRRIAQVKAAYPVAKGNGQLRAHLGSSLPYTRPPAQVNPQADIQIDKDELAYPILLSHSQVRMSRHPSRSSSTSLPYTPRGTQQHKTGLPIARYARTIFTKSNLLTLHPPPGDDTSKAPKTQNPYNSLNCSEKSLGKSRRRTAYPQQIVTTRLLYCLQDRFAQLSRLQRI
jgi:hypothetical protein